MIRQKTLKSLRQLPFSNALRHSQPSTEPTCSPKSPLTLKKKPSPRVVNSPNIQINLYFAKQFWHICAESAIQEFQTIHSLELHHIPHFVLFINGQAIYGCTVKFLKRGCELSIYIRSGGGTPQQIIMHTGTKGQACVEGFVLFLIIYRINNKLSGPSHNVCPVQSQYDLNNLPTLNCGKIKATNNTFQLREFNIVRIYKEKNV